MQQTRLKRWMDGREDGRNMTPKRNSKGGLKPPEQSGQGNIYSHSPLTHIDIHTHTRYLNSKRDRQTVGDRKEPPFSSSSCLLASRRTESVQVLSIYESIKPFSGRKGSIRLCDMNRLHPSTAIHPKDGDTAQ